MSDIKSQFKKICLKCEKRLNKITWLICGVIILLCSIFLYHYFYKTINNTNVLTKIKNQVAVKTVNMKMWQEINENLSWKKADLKEGLKNNPFK